LSGWQELPHPRAERGPHRRSGTWCRSSLNGRADALYVVNDALGSFLLRANEVIDQVPMSARGTNGHEVKASNAPSLDASLHFAACSRLGHGIRGNALFSTGQTL